MESLQFASELLYGTGEEIRKLVMCVVGPVPAENASVSTVLFSLSIEAVNAWGQRGLTLYHLEEQFPRCQYFQFAIFKFSNTFIFVIYCCMLM